MPEDFIDQIVEKYSISVAEANLMASAGFAVFEDGEVMLYPDEFYEFQVSEHWNALVAATGITERAWLLNLVQEADGDVEEVCREAKS